MKKVKSVLCAGVAMAVIASAAAFAGCMPEEKTSDNNEDSKIYAIYTQYAEAAGEDAMTYEEWLESIKGEDGKDGATWLVSNGAPANTLGKDGDLCLDSSTFKLYQRKAGAWSEIGSIKGADGEGAYEAWKALDPAHNTASKDDWVASLQGEDGEDGTKWFYGEGAPADSDKVAEAQVGDFYLDTSSGNIYCKGADGWGTPVFKFGAAGGSSVAPESGKVTIPYKMSAIVTVTDAIEEGWNCVYIDTGDQQLTNPEKLQVSNYAPDADLGYNGDFSYMARSYFTKAHEPENEDKNVYVALLKVKAGLNKFKFEINSNTTEITGATIKFKKVEKQNFEFGKKFIAPIFYDNGYMSNLGDQFTQFTEAEQGFKTFNGCTISIESSFTYSKSDAKYQLRLKTTKATSTFTTVINSATMPLVESITSAPELLNKPIFLGVKTYYSTIEINSGHVMPAYVTISKAS